MNATVLTHEAHEGPGTLGRFLRERGVRVRTIRLYAGEALPADPAAEDLIVSMGGPMNVYEDEKFPFLAGETEFLRRAVKARVPLIGVCLGAQLIARACGARVYRAPAREVGWGTVTLTEEGRRDPLFEGLPEVLPVLQWHGDTFDVPEGGDLLASSAEVPHQAFRVGEAWGLQFHVEVDGPMLAEWFAGSGGEQEILSRYEETREAFDLHARRLYENLLSRAGRPRTL